MSLDSTSVERGPDKLRADVHPIFLTTALVICVALPVLVASWLVLRDGTSTPATMLLSLLPLNGALILLGWRRVRLLKDEIALRRDAEARASQLATSDPLTGLLNRRALGDAGAKLIETSELRRLAVAMLMIDLDHFKSVNDLHGHRAGDTLLKAAADTMTEPLPAQAITARLGGDEFACAFSFDPAESGSVDKVASSILARMAEPFQMQGAEATISASIGIARTGAGCHTIDTLMRRSDIALYAAKRAGRNQHMWFDASMERELELRNEIELGLRVGIPIGQVVPWFEPQVDLATGALLGFEMLARWDHPELGIIGPSAFIAVAEESGLIGELSMSVMRAAMEEARSWDAALLLGVNISRAQMRDPWLAQKIVKLLTETGFPANRLEIEITEAALFENLGLAQSIIGSLRNQGMRVALDDFGTGYSSLTHLRSLPLDRIKIDRSFVLKMDEDSASAALVETIVVLARNLGVEVMAEGVETPKINDLLVAMGCNTGQGWTFGRAANIRATRGLLAEKGMLITASPSAMAGETVSARQRRRKAG